MKWLFAEIPRVTKNYKTICSNNLSCVICFFALFDFPLHDIWCIINISLWKHAIVTSESFYPLAITIVGTNTPTTKGCYKCWSASDKIKKIVRVDHIKVPHDCCELLQSNNSFFFTQWHVKACKEKKKLWSNNFMNVVICCKS